MTSAQIRSYGVKVDGINAGTFQQKSQYGADSIWTQETLLLRYFTLSDNQQVYLRHLYTENSSGHLIHSQSEMSINAGDTTRQHYLHDDSLARVYGPYGLKKLSQDSLVTAKDSLTLRYYSPDHQAAVTLHRSIQSYQILQAKKYWVVRDSIPFLPASVSIYDQRFNLRSSTQVTDMGKIELTPQDPKDSILSLLTIPEKSQVLPANLWLPDQKNINAVELLVVDTNNDSTQITLADNQFRPLPTDSSELAAYTKSNLWINNENLELFNLADSLTKELITEEEVAYELTQHVRNQGFAVPALELVRLARSIGLPTRLVKGYYYQYGHWALGYWTEIGIGDEWQIFHPETISPINHSLYLPLINSSLENGVMDLISTFPSPQSITISNFLRNGQPVKQEKKKHKAGMYHNPGLNLSFEIPKGYQIQTDSALLSATILILTDGKSTIQMDYLTPPTLTDRYLEDLLTEKSGNSSISTDDNLQFPCLTTTGHDLSLLIIPQGSSFLLITCSGSDAYLAMEKLTKKNLQIKK